MSRAQEVVDTFLVDVASPSPAVARLFSLLADAEHDRSEVETILRSDASFASDVLRMANSAQFARHGVSDIGYAFTLLGEIELMRIAIRAGAKCIQVPEVIGYGMVKGGI